MNDFLSNVIACKHNEIAELKKRGSLADLKAQAGIGRGLFEKNLRQPGLRLIAEIKPASPTAGRLCSEPQIETILSVYDKYASALSVLTDRSYFAGSFELLTKATVHSALPVLCKDFILDSHQVYAARLSGAEAVLLIVKILDDQDLGHLAQLVLELGMSPVFEIQNEDELRRAEKLGAKIILINNRNLETLTVSLDTTIKLAPLVKPGAIVISASGIGTSRDLLLLKDHVSRFLIGSIFMKSSDLESTFLELLSVKSACQQDSLTRSEA